MSFVHIIPKNSFSRKNKKKVHSFGNGADCWCEPHVLDYGVDSKQAPARVFIHAWPGGIKKLEYDLEAEVSDMVFEGGSDSYILV